MSEHDSAIRHLERRSVVEIRPMAPPPARAPFDANLIDLVDGKTVFAAHFSGAVDAQGTLEFIEGTPTHPILETLTGANAHRGFRKLLESLRSDDPDERSLRRLFFDIPIVSMIMMQAFIVRTPQGHRSSTRMTNDIPGVNQCAGWVAGGEMLTLIKDNDGLLEMDPSIHVITDDHLGDPAPTLLIPNATRRRRHYEVEIDGSEIRLKVNQRDSFATPDGIERVLHWWKLNLRANAQDQIIRSIEVDNGGLPWVECPSAAGSGQRVIGHRLDELEGLVSGEFKGVTTCTHLNDTLAALAGVPELLARA